MTTASLNVGFQGPDDGLQLEYRREDNLLPSELAAQQQTQANIAAGCNAVSAGPTTSEAEQNASKEALHHQDQHAWPYRKLRLYPPVNAQLRCSYGEIRAQHVVQEIEEEVLVFSGSDQGSFAHRGDPISIHPEGRVYDEAGNEVMAPLLQYRGKGLVASDRKIWGLVRAQYRTEYRVLQLACVPTGEDFDVQVVAYHDGETASVVVPYEILEFDTGQVAGVNCGGVNASPEPVTPPPPAGRYQLISFDHKAEIKLGDPVVATMVLRNINGVAGSGSVVFWFRYAPYSVSGVFQCDANGQVEISLSLTPTEKGTYQTVGQVSGDIFSRRDGTVKVIDPDDVEAENWNELSREMSDIDVEGVLIKRIETVTFQVESTGNEVKLNFDNTDVM